MLSQTQIQLGIENNLRACEKALDNQLSWIYKRMTPTSNFVRYLFASPQSAKSYLIEYMLIGIPQNAQLNNLWMVAYDDAANVKYIGDNLRRANYGAQVNLFSSPNTNKPFKGMSPIFLKVKGEQQLTFDFRGTGLGALPFFDVLILGHQQNRVTGDRGYDGNL